MILQCTVGDYEVNSNGRSYSKAIWKKMFNKNTTFVALYDLTPLNVTRICARVFELNCGPHEVTVKIETLELMQYGKIFFEMIGWGWKMYLTPVGDGFSDPVVGEVKDFDFAYFQVAQSSAFKRATPLEVIS